MRRPVRHARTRRAVGVLVVEDSAFVRTRLVGMLRELGGVRVRGAAATVADALQLLSTCKPDAVIVDLRLPDGDGLAVVRAAKALDPPPAVVILTHYAYPALRQKGLDAGADWFLDKATEVDRLPELLGGVRVRRRQQVAR